jgi:hypothetical protein
MRRLRKHDVRGWTRIGDGYIYTGAMDFSRAQEGVAAMGDNALVVCGWVGVWVRACVVVAWRGVAWSGVDWTGLERDAMDAMDGCDD